MADGNWWEAFPVADKPAADDDKWWEAFPLAEQPKAAPPSKKSGGAGEFLLDLTKRAGGAMVGQTASVPEAVQSGLRATVRSGSGGDPATVMPGGVFMPGIDTDEAINGPMTQQQRDQRELQAERTAEAVRIPGAASLASAGRDAQQAINDTTSQATKDAVANSQITGNLLKGEIDFGKDPSLRGFAMQGADVFGSMFPVMATALLTRSPGAAGAVTWRRSRAARRASRRAFSTRAGSIFWRASCRRSGTWRACCSMRPWGTMACAGCSADSSMASCSRSWWPDAAMLRRRPQPMAWTWTRCRTG